MGAGERGAGDKNINPFSFSGVAGEESINGKKFLGAIGLTKDESAVTPSLPVFEDLKKHKKEIQSYATLLVVQCAVTAMCGQKRWARVLSACTFCFSVHTKKTLKHNPTSL